MPGIAAERTDLGTDDVAHLQLLLADWTLMADLAFADLLLWLPTWNEGGFIAAAQLRPATARTHIRNIYNKLGVSSRAELILRVSPQLAAQPPTGCCPSPGSASEGRRGQKTT